MKKRKIVILGGGIAGLAAAHELTRTPALCDQNEVTLLQMGWRLGGKATSGRDALGRNLEHGLHVWFGCYNNTFGLLQDIYRDIPAPPDSPLKTWQDVAKPQAFTPIGVKLKQGWSFFPMTWPSNDKTPGPDDPSDPCSQAHPWRGMMQALRRAVPDMLASLSPERQRPFTQDVLRHPQLSGLGPVLHDALVHSRSARPASFAQLPPGLDDQLGLHEVLDLVYHLADAMHDDIAARLGFIQPRLLLALCVAAQYLDDHLLQPVYDEWVATNPIDADLKTLIELVNISLATVHGYFKDLYIPDLSYESLDGTDFRDWLVQNGADRQLVDQSSIVRVVYDTLFQYMDGDVERPSYAAGSGLGVLARIIGTFKGSVMWDIQAGMGEALIAPLYESLKNRVTFRFFNKVDRLVLSEDRQRIARIHVTRQADTTPKGKAYVPVRSIAINEQGQKLTCWPAEPFWEQLNHGEAMRLQKVNFESHWCDWPAAGFEVLEDGRDFDQVVLAISMGAYKPFNTGDDHEPNMCEELIAQSGPFAAFVNNISIVPTQALQLWSTRSLVGLGWTQGSPAAVSGPEYLNIWANMSQVLAVEPSTPLFGVRSLHYLCGTFKTDLYKRPASDKDTPELAKKLLRGQTVQWLDQSSKYQWPSAHLPDGQFDFSALVNFSRDPSPPSDKRLDDQYLRANIDPTECCVLSSAGTTRYRLHPLQSGFANLVLAGEATRHGFNTTSIEGAIMSGRAASRAICDSPQHIDYYDFLRTPVASGGKHE